MASKIGEAFTRTVVGARSWPKNTRILKTLPVPDAFMHLLAKALGLAQNLR
jgi:hypothetical protein